MREETMRLVILVWGLLWALPAVAQESYPVEMSYATCEKIAARMDAAEKAGKQDKEDDELMKMCVGSHGCTKSLDAANNDRVPSEALASNTGMLKWLKDTCSRKLRLKKE